MVRRYEYEKLDLNNTARRSDEIDLLSQAGAQGWRLVVITQNGMAYMVREIAEPDALPKSRRRGSVATNSAN